MGGRGREEGEGRDGEERGGMRKGGIGREGRGGEGSGGMGKGEQGHPCSPFPIEREGRDGKRKEGVWGREG